MPYGAKLRFARNAERRSLRGGTGVRVSGGGEAPKRVLRTKQRDAEVSKQENCEALQASKATYVCEGDNQAEAPTEPGGETIPPCNLYKFCEKRRNNISGFLSGFYI